METLYTEFEALKQTFNDETDDVDLTANKQSSQKGKIKDQVMFLYILCFR